MVNERILMIGDPAVVQNDKPDTALVTGASGDIGAEIARSLADAGCHLVLCGRNRSKLDDLAQRLTVPARVVIADLLTPSGVDNILEQLAGWDQPIRYLVNNAGSASMHSSRRQSWSDLEDTLTLNLIAPLMLAIEAEKRGGGVLEAVVNISSIAAQGAAPYQAAYSAAKAGLEGATRSLAAEWGPKGVRVNCVSPGVVRTPMTEAVWKDREYLSSVEQRIPLGRIGRPEDIAAATLFLLSPLSGFVTGQTLIVDGGLFNAYELVQ